MKIANASNNAISWFPLLEVKLGGVILCLLTVCFADVSAIWYFRDTKSLDFAAVNSIVGSLKI